MTENDQSLEPDSAKDPWYVRVLSALLAVFMFAIVVVIFSDVVGRYVLSHSIFGGFEMIAYLLGLLIFSGFPLVTRDEEHITVGLMDGAFHGRLKWARDLLVLFASVVAVWFVAYRIFVEAQLLHADGQTGEVLDIPIAPFIFTMSGLAAAAGVMLIMVLLEFIRRGYTEEPDKADVIYD